MVILRKLSLTYSTSCYSSLPPVWALCEQGLRHHWMWSLSLQRVRFVRRGGSPLVACSLQGLVSLSLGPLGPWQVEVWQWPATLRAFWSWQWYPAKSRQARPVTCSLTHVPQLAFSEETQTEGEVERKARYQQVPEELIKMMPLRTSRRWFWGGVLGLGRKEKEEWGACV